MNLRYLCQNVVAIYKPEILCLLLKALPYSSSRV